MARSLLKSTSTVGGMTMISRVLGLVRDIVLARMFGAGAGADAFFIAFKIPNFLRAACLPKGLFLRPLCRC